MIRMPSRRDAGKLGALKALPIFAGLPKKFLEHIAGNVDEANVPAGETILREGVHNETFWIILEGELDLTITEGAQRVIGAGDIIGLPSLFTGRESNATVVTRTPIRALVASHSQFNHFIGDREIEIRFKASVFDRLRDEVHQLTRAAAGRSAAETPPANAKAPATKTKAKAPGAAKAASSKKA